MRKVRHNRYVGIAEDAWFCIDCTQRAHVVPIRRLERDSRMGADIRRFLYKGACYSIETEDALAAA